VKAAELLVIDVVGEIQNLCREQLRGSWEVAAEVARLCLSRGAATLSYRSRRNGFSLRAIGCRWLDDDLDDVAVVVDPEAGQAERHRALVRLEHAEAMALLWLAGVEGAGISVSSHGPDGGRAFEFTGAGGHAFRELAGGGAEPSLEIAFRSPGFDHERAARWLRAAVRFAPIDVVVDGQTAPRGFQDVLAEVSMSTPLRGRVAVSWSGDAPQLWLLRHGVVSTRATVPGYPAFTAAVEMADTARPGSTPAELRQAVNPHLRGIIDAAGRLMVSVGRRMTELSGTARRRVACLLMQAAIRGLWRDEIFELPIVTVREPGTGEEKLGSLREVAATARRKSGVVVCEDADSPMDRPPAVPVVILTDEERGLLTDLLEIRLERPLRRGRGGVWRRAATAAERARRWLIERLRGGFRGGEVPDDELLDVERRLLRELDRRAGEALDVRLCAGGGGVRKRGRRLLLPRRDPLVAGSVRLMARDGDWLYPVASALIGDHAELDSELRTRWLRRVLRGSA